MKKGIKTLIGIVIGIIIIFGIIFFIDYTKVSNLKMPMFVIEKGTENDITTYWGLGYKVEVRKYKLEGNEEQITQTEMYMYNRFITGAVASINIENKNNYKKNKLEDLPKQYSLINAVVDNCVVSIHGSKIYNKDELDRFLKNVENNTQDFIRCINYTIEGDMIITDVYFEGDNNFRAILDSTRDKWSNEKDRTYENCKFTKLEIEEASEGTNITLKEKVEGNIEELVITWYNKDAQVINDYENNFLLEIKSSEKRETENIVTNELKEKYNYNIYYYGIDSLKVKIDGEKIDLKEALKTEKITMEQIINQAEKDKETKIISVDILKDGGTKIYNYGSYIIIKRHSIIGLKEGYIEDVYIGIPEMLTIKSLW